VTAVIVNEVKRNAVGGYTKEQGEKWFHWVARAESVGRARPVEGSSTLIGNDWEIVCDDPEEATWLCHWLTVKCGFHHSMLTIR